MNKTILVVVILAVLLTFGDCQNKLRRGSNPRKNNAPSYNTNTHNSGYPSGGYSNGPSRGSSGSPSNSYPSGSQGGYPSGSQGGYPSGSQGSYPGSSSSGSSSIPSRGSSNTPSTGSTSAPSSNSSSSATQGSDFISTCLQYQNIFRQPLGEADLTWSTDLAAGAQQWADTMASTSNFAHSGKAGVGENIAAGSVGSYDAQKLIELWTNEKQYFIPGCKFPACTTGGEVGHYTQIVWKATTQVGCGIASNSQMTYMCCQYSVPGNYIGQSPY